MLLGPKLAAPVERPIGDEPLRAAWCFSALTVENIKMSKDLIRNANIIYSTLAFAVFLSSPALGQTLPNLKTSSEVYSDWELLCIERLEEKTCQAKQAIMNDQDNLVSVIEIAKVETGAIVIQIALPHMLDLSMAPTIAVDQSIAFDIAYKFCNQQACFVLSDNPSIFDAFVAGNQGKISALTLNGDRWEIGFSLSGFKDAYEKLAP